MTGDPDPRPPGDDGPVLTVRGLRVTYLGGSGTAAGDVDAVRDVTFSIGRGEILGIVGESGSGKSTICGAVLGLLGPSARVSADELALAGRDLRHLSERRWTEVRGRDVALVPQQPMTALSPVTPVGRQLDWYFGDGAVARHRDDLLGLGLDAVVDRPGDLPSSFSGGQLQRVLIAIATLAARPKLLLADEPTSTLDPTVQATVLDLLVARCRSLGGSMLFVSHDLAVVAQVCDRVGVMQQGELVELAPVADLFDSPRHPYTRSLVGARPPVRSPGGSGRLPPEDAPPAGSAAGPAQAGTDELGDESSDLRLTPAPVDEGPGRSMDPDDPDGRADDPDGRRGTPGGGSVPPALVLDRVYRYYGPTGSTRRSSRAEATRRTVRAVDEVSLVVQPGTTTAIVGESGAGKSTLAKLVVGALAPTAGTISLDGRELAPTRTLADRRAVQLVPQNHRSALNRRRSIGHALVQAQRVHGIGDGRRDRAERGIEALAAVGLSPEIARRRPSALSGGELARAVLARSVLLEPRVLLLDEPTASLDAQVKVAVLDLLNGLQDRLGLTLVVITHELPTARALADRIAVMDAGRIVEEGPTPAVLDHPAHEVTRSLLASLPTDPTARP